MTDDVTTVGGRLRYMREARTLTQRQLAADAKVSRATINRIEQGWPSPQLATLAKLADALRVDTAWLVKGIGEPNEKRAAEDEPRRASGSAS